jgi:3-phosphoglycerate kinase
MAKLSFRDLEAKGKRVFVRVDYNVPLKDGDSGAVITDDTRIRASLPTIKHLLEQGARVILASHLGRPKGEKKAEFSLAPVAVRLGELLETEVQFLGETVGPAVEAAANALGEGKILLLENVRFFPGETDNEPSFAKQLAVLADLYVNDAFGTAHRAHASTAGVAEHVSQAAMGSLVERELQYLQGELQDPKRPFVVILGGKKVSDKIGVINALMDKADTILIGGAMQYAFRKAQGYNIGQSFCSDADVPIAKDILAQAEAKGATILLPADSLEADDFSDTANTNNIAPYNDGGAISDGWEGIDIGKQAIVEFCEVLKDAQTVIWNGPMGAFEIAAFASGTKAVGEALAANTAATTIIGGGDSVTAVNQFGLSDQMTFMSTGGGASLELLEGKILPGVAALTDQA